MVVSATALTGGSLGGTLSGLASAMIITEFKDFVAPPLLLFINDRCGIARKSYSRILDVMNILKI